MRQVSLFLFLFLLTACNRMDKAETEQAFTFSYDSGVYYLKERQFDRAVEECTRCLKLDPNSEKAHTKLAAAYIGLGQFDRAMSGG